MKRKDNAPRSDYDYELDDIILEVVEHKVYLNIERIRTLINERYSRKLGWVTIKRHIDRMVEKDQINVAYESVGKRKIPLYKLVDSSRVITIK